MEMPNVLSRLLFPPFVAAVASAPFLFNAQLFPCLQYLRGVGDWLSGWLTTPYLFILANCIILSILLVHHNFNRTAKELKLGDHQHEPPQPEPEAEAEAEAEAGAEDGPGRVVENEMIIEAPTLESVWKKIRGMEGRHPPQSVYRQKHIRCMTSQGSGRQSSAGVDEFNKRAEAFISKFNQDMRLQKQDSLLS